MYQDSILDSTIAHMGNDSVAYLREITSDEIHDKFPHVENVNGGMMYWAMFAADGSLLMLADSEKDLTHSAFYSDLVPIKPN